MYFLCVLKDNGSDDGRRWCPIVELNNATHSWANFTSNWRR